jgi:hypothetical protein
MNGHTYPPPPYQTGATRLDDLTPISPFQQHYNPNAFQAPYPDSAGSSAPSDDPVIADADEDKRRRNQAASARFRQKKKQREAHMLELSRDAVEKNKKLEGELEGLKKENTFLRQLLVEKVDNMSEEDRALLVKATKDATKEKA